MQSWNPYTIPNLLTGIRFAIAFWLIAAVFIQPDSLWELRWWAFFFIAIAFITDYLDGWIARNWINQQSKLGEYMDPPADKLAVGSYMLYLYMVGIADGTFEVVCFSLIMLREAFMWTWRIFGGTNLFPVNKLGKWKSGVQMITLLLYGVTPVVPQLYPVSVVALFAATLLTGWSLTVYVLRGPQRVNP